MTRNEFIETYYRNNYEERLKFARKRVDNYNLTMAEDALQEAFCRAIKYFKAYDKEEDFDNWFGKILVNCINDIKRIERDKGVNQKEHIENDYVATVSFSKDVIDLLNKETERNQNILNMYFFYKYKSREIAEFMNVNHDVVRDVIRTFRRKARHA